MEFRILGPLEVRGGHGSIPLGSTKQRALLAIFLLHANELVSRDRLIEELWGGRAPPSAGHTLEAYIHRLRKALRTNGEGPLVTRSGGYLLRLDPDALDLHRFERLVAEGRSALAADAPERAAAKLTEALALWRGRPLADLEYEPFGDAQIPRLEELWLEAIEERIEAELALGRHERLVSELEGLVAEQPLRERFRLQLMIALYRSGRQADALRVYREARAFLADELGLEPGPELQELERAILTHDPGLAAARPRPAVVRGRPALLAGALLLVIAGAVGSVFLITRGGKRAATPTPNAVVAVDPKRNAVDAVVPVGARPGPIAAGSGALWVTNLDDGTVSRIDPRAHKLVRSIPVGDGAADLAASHDAVWSIGSSPNAEFASVRRIDPRFDSVGAPTLVQGSAIGGYSAGLAATGDGVWAIAGTGVLSRIDGASGLVSRTLYVSSRSSTRRGSPTISAAGGTVWVADAFANTVTRIDPPGSITAVVRVGHGPVGIAVGLGGVWVSLSLDDRVIEIDPATNTVERAIQVGRFPIGIVTGLGSVWVANSRDGTISRIDPVAGRVIATIHVGGSPQRLAIVHGSVWVTVQQDVFAAGGSTRGGVARVTARLDPGTLDPALVWTPLALQLEYATCAKLVNYADRPGAAGALVVPDVARSLPTVSADGLTYTFRLRNDFRFSPPSDERVTAETFKYSIERSLDPRMRGSAGTGRAAALVTAALDDVVGAGAFGRGQARHVSGITTRGNSLTIRLVRPAGDLLARLATPYYCAVPLGTPIRPTGVQTVPSAGPYYVAVYSPGARVVLRRNPGYPGRRPHRLEEIDVDIGIPPTSAVGEVESGAADYVADGLTAADARRLAARYGPRGGGAQRYFEHPGPAIAYLAFNTSRGIFADARLRRAVSFAIDRTALSEVGKSFDFPGVVNAHYLPPGMPGFRDVPLYPSRPEPGEALKLARHRSRSVVFYYFQGRLADEVVRILRVNLRPLGIRLIVRTFPPVELFRRVARKGEPFDLTTGGWIADYYDPAAILNSQLDPSSIGAPESLNLAHFVDPAYRRRLEAAERLSGAARERTYARLALDLARKAVPWIAISTQLQQDFVSARMGCVVYQPIYRLDLAALCIRPRNR